MARLKLNITILVQTEPNKRQERKARKRGKSDLDAPKTKGNYPVKIGKTSGTESPRREAKLGKQRKPTAKQSRDYSTMKNTVENEPVKCRY